MGRHELAIALTSFAAGAALLRAAVSSGAWWLVFGLALAVAVFVLLDQEPTP